MPRILIAEDRNDTAELLRMLLARQGHEVDVVADGGAAVKSHGAGGYELVILDAAMPEVDGFSAALRIRETDGLTPILMVTAHNDPITKAHARRSQIDHIIFKPFDALDVTEAVDYLLKHGRA